MGKPYDFRYYKPGQASVGEMMCGACRNAIDGNRDEFRSCKKNKDGDWGYVTHHRNCARDDPEWARRDTAEANARARSKALIAELSALLKRYPEFSVEDFMEDARSLTDGGR